MTYKGMITMHSEQSCGNWPQFHDDRGLHGDKKQYWNWNWTINFGKKTNIKHMKIWDNNDKLIYDAPWTFQRTAGVPHHVYPNEVGSKEWDSILCAGDNRCEIETDEVVDSLQKAEEAK